MPGSADLWRNNRSDRQKKRFTQTLAGDPFISNKPSRGKLLRDIKQLGLIPSEFYLNAPFWPLGCAELEIQAVE